MFALRNGTSKLHREGVSGICLGNAGYQLFSIFTENLGGRDRYTQGIGKQFRLFRGESWCSNY